MVLIENSFNNLLFICIVTICKYILIFLYFLYYLGIFIFCIIRAIIFEILLKYIEKLEKFIERQVDKVFNWIGF